MAQVLLKDIHVAYDRTVTIPGLSLEIGDGELVTLLGPSGCGKTTVLRTIAGFIQPLSGKIFFDGQDVTHIPVHKRETAMVFQRYALFPHMTVLENIAFGLSMRHMDDEMLQARIKNVLDMMQMKDYIARYPHQLSGGQQQRVAIARALAVEPKVFLLDEPFSNLDAQLRIQVREEIKLLQQRLGLTMVFVTHDQQEALAIADRMVVIHQGKIQQLGAPGDLYEHPESRFVAEFLGKMNLFKGHTVQANSFQCENSSILNFERDVPRAGYLGVRPEKLTLHESVQANQNNMTGKIQHIIYQGSGFEVQVSLASQEIVRVQTLSLQTADSGKTLGVGDTVYLAFAISDSMLFTA